MDGTEVTGFVVSAGKNCVTADAVVRTDIVARCRTVFRVSISAPVTFARGGNLASWLAAGSTFSAALNGLVARRTARERAPVVRFCLFTRFGWGVTMYWLGGWGARAE